MNKVLILGDNFIAESYRKGFKKAGEEFFLKKHFEVMPFCSSKYNDKNANLLSRLQHSFATALNSKVYLPAYVVIVFDDDLIEYLGHKKFKVASMYGQWIEFLAKTFHEMLQLEFDHLSECARPDEPTQLYWLEAVTHHNFAPENTQCREIFNNCLDSVLKIYEDM